MAQSQPFSSLAAFSGGVVAGAIAFRLLPPILSQVSGPAQVAMGRDPLDLLVHDHKLVLAALDRLLKTPDDAVGRRAAMFFHIKRSLAAHAMAEEDVVYPILHAKEKTAARKLYDDHADIKVHLWQLETMPKNDPTWRDVARELREVIEGHARQEEEVEFPRVREAVDSAGWGHLLGSIMREKALIL